MGIDFSGLADVARTSAVDAMMVTDHRGLIVAVNPAFSGITGFSASEAIGRPLNLIESGLHPPEFYAHIDHSLGRQGWWEGQAWCRRRQGAAFLSRLSISAVHDAGTGHHGYVVVLGQPTKPTAVTPPAITDLCSRAGMIEHLDRTVANAMRTERHVTVLMIDLQPADRSDQGTDPDPGQSLRYDALEIAERRICGAMDATMLAGRIAEDRIAIVCDPAGPREAVRLADAFVSALAPPAVVGAREIRFDAAVGIAVFPQDGEDGEALLRHGEEALRNAQTGQNGRWSFVSPARTAFAEHRLRLEARLRRAVENGEFELHFQPKICLKTQSVRGIEGLARWTDPDLGSIPPSVFIPLAEEAGLIAAVGEWAVTEACRFLAANPAEGMEVAVNLSASHFLKRDLVKRVLGIIGAHGVPAHRLALEITESAVLAEPEQALKTLRDLRGEGIGIAIDDFGTGYSCLAHLKQLPVDTLKLDKSFIADILNSPTDQRIVRTVLALGHVLGMCVVAEGVEDAAQAALLARWGVDAGQGYFYARPMPGAALLEWMAARRVAKGPCGCHEHPRPVLLQECG